jgi:fructose-1,6-bisphosphatase/inositol monophosphatase family enzyme
MYNPDMTYIEAYELFEKMLIAAEEELLSFTTTTPLTSEEKADKSLVTACDKQVDEKLSHIAREAGLQVVSEEGEHALDIVRSGNYMTIDPIDGTLGYIEYVNYALENGGIENFLQKDLGATSDFCLLLGIVENGIPMYGAVYNFVTKEKILIDGNDKSNLLRENNVRNYSQEYAVYVDQRPGDGVERELTSLPDTSVIKQAALGLKSVYTIINPHESAITAHRVQTAGLWDVLPAAVAARAFGGEVYDAQGGLLKLNEYIILPGTGATIIRGEKFKEIWNQIDSKKLN